MNESTKRQLQIGNSMNVPMLSSYQFNCIACKPGQFKGTSTLTVGLRWKSFEEVKTCSLPTIIYSTQCPTLDYSIPSSVIVSDTIMKLVLWHCIRSLAYYFSTSLLSGVYSLCGLRTTLHNHIMKKSSYRYRVHQPLLEEVKFSN